MATETTVKSALLPEYIVGETQNSSLRDSENGQALEKEKHPIKPLRSKPVSSVQKFCYIIINIVSAVAIIFVNKLAMSDSSLAQIPISIVVFHSLCTTALLYLISRPRIRMFTAKRAPIRSIYTLAAGFGLYVTLGLLSIASNPVSIYQMGKVLNGPVVAGLNVLLFGEKMHLDKSLSIGAICSGVVLTIKGGWEKSTIFGLSIVLLSTTTAAIYQIWVGRKHNELGLTSSQLLMNQAPLVVVLLLPMVPIFDNITTLLSLTRPALYTVLATGLIASLVNLSQFLVIQSTSALTFNVVSQFKTCAILLIAYVSDGKSPSLLDTFGIIVTLSATIWYSAISMKEQARSREK